MSPKTKKTNIQAADRWTKDLAKQGHTQVVKPFLAFYPLLNITPSEALLIINLMSYKWGPENPYPCARKLAMRMGVEGTRRVRQMLKNLEDKGLLFREERRRDDGGKTSNSYDLKPLFIRLEHLMETDEGKRLLHQTENLGGADESA